MSNIKEKEEKLLLFCKATGIGLEARGERQEFKDKEGRMIPYPRTLRVSYHLTIEDDK